MTLKTPFIPTPWGVSLTAEELLPGVTFVQTPSHGGYHLNAAVNARIPAVVRRADGWYEQDVQGALCARFVPLPGADQVAARVMIRQAFPHLELP